MVSQELMVLGISAAITLGIQLSGFAVAYWLQTEKFYDILGKYAMKKRYSNPNYKYI
jgi:hypothetical protein